MASRGVFRPLAFVLILFLSFLSSAFGQGSKVKSVYDSGEERDRDRPDLREQWFANGRTAPPGESRAALRLRAHRQKMQMRAQREAAAAARGAGSAATGSPGWIALGPAPLDSNAGLPQDYNLVSGRAIAVAIDPADSSGNMVFVGGAFGGLWKSVNGADPSGPGAVVWQPLLDNQPSLAVGAVAIQPGNSKVILVGTGESNSAIDSYYGAGILRSTDGGITWQQIAAAQTGQSFLGLGFTKIAFSTQNPNLLVAATAGDLGFNRGREEDGNSTARGLYYSLDGGQTWSRVTLTDNAVPSSVTDVVYNASQGANGTFYAFIRRHGMYSSSDGVNWTPLALQPYSGINSGNCPAGSNSTTCPIYRGQLAVLSGAGRNELYAWVEDQQGTVPVDNGIYQSLNGGSSWNLVESPANSGITNCGDNAFGSGHSGCGVQQGYYNLELGAVAVPNGSGTDLYAGAVNLWKCSLPTGSSSCSSSANWINLTHVYGCNPLGAPARLHPDQHAIAFMVSPSDKAIGYFANDGGIYRTLDAFTQLTSGSCTPGSNGFDSLNQTLGSMTQFVSFSVDPTNQDNVLGGTQDNGSPKTGTATTSQSWANANGGDGGYNIINFDQVHHPNEWFTSNTYVSIQVCEQGVKCNGPAFNLLVDSTTIGGDEGPFYTPYILDPQNSGELLVGTCRVWQGTTSGTNFSPLNTFSFDNTGVPCTGSETDLVRGLAAGGPVDPTSHLSKVVYATTTGTGPLAQASDGGEVWVTTAGGKMSQVTGGINPLHYTISSVAIDNADSSGRTAYVGIMGFVGNTATHIWKTTNAGTSWSSFGSVASGLPDAPVNALLIDPQASQVYAGTDVGVFVSPTTSPSWTEVGPAPGSGQAGYLPNVPVTAIRLFNHGGTKKLRVSTYGRGIWEYPLSPDYEIAISNTPQTVLPNQPVTFNGTLTAISGYASPVTLSCTGTTPAPCTFSPGNSVTPTPGGAPFSVSLNSGALIANYHFNVHGTDGTLAHDFAVTLNVTDFSMGTPNPATVSVVPGETSNATQYQLGSLGPFNGTVDLSCSAGLPTGTSCNFSPSSQVTLSPANPSARVSTTVSAASNTPAGSYPVTISAATSGEAAKTQSFTVQVMAADFQWTGGGTHQVLAGQVTLSYSFTATPSGGTFVSNVTFGCGSLPALTHCSFSPPSIPIGTAGAQPVAITISTTGPNPGIGPLHRRGGNRNPWLPLTAPLAGVVMVGVWRRRMRRQHVVAVLCVSLALLGLLVACGGGGGSSNPPPPPPPPPPPTISVTVALMAGEPSSLFPNDAADGWPTQTAQFQATVNNSANQAVNWAVVGGSANGTIDANGVYSAPTVAPGLPGSVTITATAQADTTKSGSAVETLTPATIPGTYNNILVTAADSSATFSNTVTLIVQ